MLGKIVSSLWKCRTCFQLVQSEEKNFYNSKNPTLQSVPPALGLKRNAGFSNG